MIRYSNLGELHLGALLLAAICDYDSWEELRGQVLVHDSHGSMIIQET